MTGFWATLSLVTSIFATLVSGQFGLSSQLFQLQGGSSVNNAKLFWAQVTNATSYSVSRRAGSSGSFNHIATVGGNTLDDYALSLSSQTYTYQVTALNSAGTSLGTSTSTQVTPFTPSSNVRYETYNNTVSSTLDVRSPLVFNGVYYRFNYASYSNGSMQAIVQQTSKDGYTFSGDTEVLSGQTVCASISGNSCHLERITTLLNPTTNNFVLWAHLENTANYDLAQVAVAYAVPGHPFTFAGTYRPLGHDSRDLTFWADNDSAHSAYLISSTDTNTNTNIYALSANWTTIASLAAEVLVNQYREAPAMAKHNGVYYLYTSRAAGWYPSLPEYITATNIAGPWSDPAVFGNTATFSTQSGSVVQIGNGGPYAMLPDRWSANWVPAAGPNREILLPISFASNTPFSGTAFYRTVAYNDTVTPASQALYGIQSGKILSVGRPSSSNAGSQNIGAANDGVQTDPNTYFTPSTVPFYYQIDLGTSTPIAQVDLTTRMIQGSETYYQFTIAGSVDGSSFTTLADHSKNTDVGFVSTGLSARPTYRYVRINVQRIINTHNGNEADFARGVEEATVYGG